MVRELARLDEPDERTYGALPSNLTGIDRAKVDWRPHPGANDVRWIAVHPIWCETWVSNANEGAGRHAEELWPAAIHMSNLDEIEKRLAGARMR